MLCLVLFLLFFVYFYFNNILLYRQCQTNKYPQVNRVFTFIKTYACLIFVRMCLNICILYLLYIGEHFYGRKIFFLLREDFILQYKNRTIVIVRLPKDALNYSKIHYPQHTFYIITMFKYIID